MLLNAHYLVSPNERLRQLATVDEDLELLCEPFLVTSKEGGAHDRTTADEYALRVKIFALLRFTNEYLSTVESIERLLDRKRVDQELFDSWWNLLRIGEVEQMPTFGQKFRVTNIQRRMVTATGSEAVEEWLTRVAEFY